MREQITQLTESQSELRKVIVSRCLCFSTGPIVVGNFTTQDDFSQETSRLRRDKLDLSHCVIRKNEEETRLRGR